MKKFCTAILVVLLFFQVSGQVSAYQFSSNIGTYVPITQGTVRWTGAVYDVATLNNSIGFNFKYNGTTYYSFCVSSNGYIALGSALNNSSTPLSSGVTNQIVVALGARLQGNTGTGEVRYQTIGTAPYRTLVVQWTSFRRYSFSGNLNFQIRLEETTNDIVIQYGTMTESSSYSYQVGLRGNSSADFNNRKTSTDWLNTIPGTTNTATCLLSTSVYPSNGLKFNWDGSFPAVFSVTGGGTYCEVPGSGLPVGLSGSETGVTYTLFRNNVVQGISLAGTGSPISFGNQPMGVYTVSGVNTAGTTLMSGNATISLSSESITPIFDPIGPLCPGSSSPPLPSTSLNNIPGTWNPTTVNTSIPGTSVYYFTPDPGQCATPFPLNVTIYNSLVSDPVSGPIFIAPGAQGVVYSIEPHPGDESFLWEYLFGTGVSINGSGNAVTLDFASNATGGTLRVTRSSVCGNIVSYLNITVVGNPPIRYTVDNVTLVSSSQLEFDLHLLNVSFPGPFELSTVQAGILVNPYVYNGGTLTASIVPGSSQLNPAQIPTVITFTQTSNVIKLAPKSPPGWGNGTILSNNPQSPTRICRIRLTNTNPFTACITPNLAFSFVAYPYPTKLSYYIDGINTTYPVSPDNCFSNAVNQGLNCITTWTGSAGNDWFNVNNWNLCVPQAATQVTIPKITGNYPTLTSAATCASITIENGASFIGSEFLNTGNAIVKRQFPLQGYHCLSSPVNYTTFGEVFPLNQTEVWAYRYDEPSGNWINRSLADVMSPGTGYSVKVNSEQTAIFNGQLNRNSLTMPLSKLNNGGDQDREGWNLLGNPFTSAICWDLVNPGAGVDGAVYVWNGTSYLSYVGGVGSLPGGIIPAENGFLVKTNIDHGTLTIPLAARFHSSISIYKRSVSNLLTVKVTGNNYSDETFIHFLPEASSTFDSDFDAYKLKGSDETPQLYTKSDDHELSINSLPIEGNDLLELDFECSVSGNYSLNFDGTRTFSPDFSLLLQDLKTGIIHDVRSNSAFTFSHDAGLDVHRFNLLYGSRSDLQELFPIRVSSNSDGIVIENYLEGSGNIHVTDITGRELRLIKPGSLKESTIRLNLIPGIYIVGVENKNGIISRKVLVP